MYEFLKFYFVGRSQSSAQKRTSPYQLRQQMQGSIEEIITQSLKSNFLFSSNKGLSIYGCTIHQVDPIFGISLTFFIRIMPSPWQPAEGLAMNVPPLFSIFFVNVYSSSGRRQVLGQNQNSSGQYSLNLLRMNPMVRLWQRCGIAGIRLTLIQVARSISQLGKANPDHSRSPSLKTSTQSLSLISILSNLSQLLDRLVFIFSLRPLGCFLYVQLYSFSIFSLFFLLGLFQFYFSSILGPPSSSQLSSSYLSSFIFIIFPLFVKNKTNTRFVKLMLINSVFYCQLQFQRKANYRFCLILITPQKKMDHKKIVIELILRQKQLQASSSIYPILQQFIPYFSVTSLIFAKTHPLEVNKNLSFLSVKASVSTSLLYNMQFEFCQFLLINIFSKSRSGMRLLSVALVVANFLAGGLALPNPCVPECTAATKCYLSKCVPLDQLPLVCSSNSDCGGASYICNAGQCEYKPAAILLPPSLPPPPKICTKACISGYECRNGICVPIDKCAAIKCKPGFECVSGLCVKQSDSIPVAPVCISNADCADQEACIGGKCLYNCHLAKCGGGYICLHGSCGLPYAKCTKDEECGLGEKCHKLGKCVNKCTGVTCPKGKVCVQGVCQNEKCGKVDCPKGTYCKKGQCVPDIHVCPANSKYEVKVCTEPRPNDITCPQIFYIRAPDPAFCGVTADGTRINFAEQCTTCKDKSIVYYFKAPCHKVPFVCQSSGTCEDYYCTSRCLNNQMCPYNWQLCAEGKCIDSCAVLRCDRGTCKFGQCNFEYPSGTCTLGPDSGCKEGLECIGFECHDPCLTKACPNYQKCVKGQCVSDVPRTNL